LFNRDRQYVAMPTLLLLLLVLLPIGAACANDNDDHERARDAVRRGEILPLEQILAMHARPDERVLEVEIDRKGRRWEYELELLGDDGRVRELEIDGASGRLLDEDVEKVDNEYDD
jgi:uncharacterized membrane protein YkoI